ncbi:hypothetical protein AB6N23_01780 [Cellulomonas sp. 179-A 9B4 NHS]|uniref:hypothetical protein n=1 Tax=Cellulomonas sp. 179-A 9B4 NHS TaxID=3142379 RepID=UPI0039A25E32
MVVAENCGVLDFTCKAEQLATSAIGDAIENMATAVLEAYGKSVASLGTIWVNIGTPNLTGGGGSSAITAGSAAPDSGNITTVLAYVTWISLAVAVLSLFMLGGLIATRMRTGEGVAAVGKLGLVLAAVVLISGAGALVSGLMPARPRGAGGAVLFLQSGLWWYMGAAAVVSVIIGGARMVWEQRAEPGRDTVRSLLTLVVVAGAGVTIVGLLVAAADSFSVWLINGSLGCDVTAPGSTCFGENMLALLALTTNPAAGGLGALLIIILGLIAILASAFQIVLMVARGGMLVILTGILPLSASFTNTEMGRTWFKKCIAWLVAFILYKPAAAIVYAAAFQLSGTDVFSDDGTGLLAVLTGLMLMVIALFAMPALMRFVTPMVGAMAVGGGGAALAAGTAAALPSGAASVGRLGTGAGSSASSAGSSGAQGPAGGAGPSGNHAAGGNPAPAGSQNGAPHNPGAAAQRTGSVPAARGTGAAAASGAGAAAGGAGVTASGAAAGAAAGPVGLAAGAALDAGTKAGQAAAGTARRLGHESTGEGGGPDGSR